MPIPDAAADQQRICERLADALIWLHRPGAKKHNSAPTGLMIAYFEQWLNGLVYELFFPEDLHARKLQLFDETARLNPPDLSKLSDAAKLERLGELFEKAYASNGPLRGSLFELRSLEVVRIIEEASNQNTAAIETE